MLTGFFRFIHRQIRRLIQAVKLLALPGQVDPYAGGDIDNFVIAQGQVQPLTNSGGLRANELFR